MNNRFKGKCYWVDDNFNYNKAYKKEYEHTVREINMIQFFIPELEPLNDYHSYSVYLNRMNIGTEYVGIYHDGINEDNSDEVRCEKFSRENDKKHIFYGTWKEDGIKYTWWAIIEVDK